MKADLTQARGGGPTRAYLGQAAEENDSEKGEG